MNVWVVYANTFGDPDTTCGVYATLEAAAAAIAEYEESRERAYSEGHPRRFLRTEYAISGPLSIDDSSWAVEVEVSR